MGKKYTIMMILFCMNYQTVFASSNSSQVEDNVNNHEDVQEQFKVSKHIAKFKGHLHRIGELKRTKELEELNQEKYDVLPKDEEDTVLNSCSILIPDTSKLAKKFQGSSPEIPRSESSTSGVQSSFVLEVLTQSFDDEESSNESTPHSKLGADSEPHYNSPVVRRLNGRYDEEMLFIDFEELSGEK